MKKLALGIGILFLIALGIPTLAVDYGALPNIKYQEKISDNSCNPLTVTSPTILNLNDVSIGDTSLTTESQAKKIADTDNKKIIKLLNKAYSDEWLSYYQYWVGSKIVRGPNKEAVIAELTLHSTEELGHAVLLTTRIIQLGGTPVADPQDWFKLTNCGYYAPNDPDVIKVLEQNIKSEQCAIKMYNELLVKSKDKDPVTYNIILGILQMEVEHEEDLQALLDDIAVITNP
jgi:bacterioferritin